MRKLLTLAFVMTFVQALGLGSPFTTTQAHAAAALAPARPQQAPAAEEADDPLRGNYNVATASDLLLVWTEQPGDVPPTTSFQKIYEVQPNPSAPPLYTLDTGNAKQSETGQNGVHGNEHISAATGDFDGNGLDDAVAAWEGANNRVTLVVPQIISDTLSWSQATRLQSGATQIDSSESTGGRVRLITGDFDGDGEDEIALAFQEPDGRVRIELYDTDGSIVPQARAFINDQQVPTNSGLSRFDIAAGDLNDDGDDELILVGFEPVSDPPAFVQLYDVTGAGSTTLTARGRTTISVAPNEIGDRAEIVVATGDFDYAADSLDEEIAVGLNYYLGGDIDSATADTYLYLLQSDADLTDPTFDPAQRVEELVGNENHPIRLELAAGDMNKDGRDEIAFAAHNNVSVYEPNSALELTLRATVSNVIIGEPDAYRYSQNFIGIGDVDSDLAAELIIAHNDYYGSADGEGKQVLSFTIYQPELDDTNVIQGLTQVADVEDETVTFPQFAQPVRRHYALALGDFDGDGYRLGKPAYYETTEIVQPLVILNAPPNHFDIFDDNGNSFPGPPYPEETYRDVNNCYNTPRFFFTSCPFTAQYIQVTTTAVGVTTQVKQDWSVSAGVSVDIKGIFEAGLKTTYGESFSRLQGSSQEISISEAVTARTEDQIYATVIDYDVWEYPIYERGGVTPAGTLLVVVPKRIKDEWFGIKSYNAIALETQHEVGNLLSYMEDIPSNPDVEQAFHASVYNLSDGKVNWGLKIANFEQENIERTKNLGLEANASVGYKGLGLELSGTYAKTDLSTHETSVQDDMEIQIELEGINLSIGDVRFAVEPYAYWSTDGTLVVDYAVRPETAPPGQPKTWWDVHYKNVPDPAFKLLWRYDPEKGFALTDPRKRFLNWEIVADPRDPAVGEQTTIRVPVYNYSLVPVANVPVHIYQGDPANGGTLIGETVTGEIPPRGKEVVAVDWTVPDNVSRFASIYAVIDPDDSLNEVHENNNLSFNTVTLGCVDCAAPNLSLAAEDIRFAPGTPTPGETVAVSATIQADRAAANVGVTFYRGNPDQGQRIGQATVLEISAGGTGVASILWDTTGLDAGEYEIWAVVDEQPGEPNTEDNRTSQSITLQSEGTTDPDGSAIYLPITRR